MKILNCLQAHKSLSSLSKNKMPLSVSFQVARNVSDLAPIVDDFHKERDKRISELNGVKDKESKEAKEMAASFQKELDELLDAEVEMNLSVLNLSECKDLFIAPEDLVGCSDFITIGDANKDG
jgi:hypothetical protein